MPLTPHSPQPPLRHGAALVWDGWWRALAYSLRPRVMAWSLLPLLLLVCAGALLAYAFWEPALYQLGHWLQSWALTDSLMLWLGSVGLGHLRMVFMPLLLTMLVLPVLVLLALLGVACFMTPLMVRLVVQRRFPTLQAQPEGTFWRSLALSAGAGGLALLVLFVTMPLWLVPPFGLVLPPLIWGWLTYRVMTHDVLVAYASPAERAQLRAQLRGWLMAMGVLCACLGSLPSLVWYLGAMTVVMAPLLLPLAIWIYTYVFAFSALWFAHVCLGALAALRHAPEQADPT